MRESMHGAYLMPSFSRGHAADLKLGSENVMLLALRGLGVIMPTNIKASKTELTNMKAAQATIQSKMVRLSPAA